MVRPGRPERNRAARSFRQLRRFHRVINSDKVFGTHNRELATKGKPENVPGENIKATAEELGIDRKDIHEARIIRDAEVAEPGLTGGIFAQIFISALWGREKADCPFRPLLW
jgi:hypothetical protein